MAEDNNWLRYYLRVWRKSRSTSAQNKEIILGNHLNDTELAAMARSGGLVATDQAANLKHLSLCPQCQDRWAEWAKAVEATNDLKKAEEPSAIMSYGMVDVAGCAATEKTASACGNFQLTVTPSEKNPNHGSIIVEYIGHSPDTIEGKMFCFKSGEIRFEGQFQQRQLIGNAAELNQIDLSMWSIIEKTTL